MQSEELTQTISDIIISIIIGVFCSLLFLILNFWFKAPWYITNPLCVTIFVILFITCSRKQRQNVIKLVATTHEVKTLLKNVSEKMKIISDYQEKITDEVILHHLSEVNEITERIFKVLQNDPRKVKSARQFTSCYLESTIKVLKLYTELKSNAVSSTEMRTLQFKIQNMLISLKSAYEKQLEKLLRNDIMNLNTEIEVLETLLKLEA